ncbi:hypothetical protein MCAP1_000095 [Malassezia caprae]|uniref:UDENN domain-containing protein n=1 Tax=Malassezia caprae TaxID=1381934 RepID=A0AAF0ITN2_9BASI|nr:hypothetical protein MCAP1_000095 [Malassezia caprae]
MLSRRASETPCDVHGLFVAEFHVRHGNSIVYRDPPSLHTDGLEWTVLPSGAHAVTRDTIYFSYDEQHMGVAAFHQHDLAGEDEDARAAQRGARSVSVALVVPCGATPGSQLTALLPHLVPLASLAQKIAAGASPPTLDVYMAKYAQRTATPQHTLLQLAYDPVTYLLTVHRFLGPLIPPLLKALHVPRRILLYCPPPMERAAIVAFNLAELMHASFVHAPGVPGDVRVRGLVTLHDMDALMAEPVPPATAWIAWTSDRLLLDKTRLYDISVDVSSCAFLPSAPPPPATRPIARLVSGPSRAAVPLRWSTRDLSLFLELAEQERRFEALLTEEGRPTFRAWCEAEALPDTCDLHLSVRPPWQYTGQDARSRIMGYLVVCVAMLRFWLAEWWLVRAQLHIVVPLALVMPLGVRGDGGMSSGIVDLGDDASVSSESAPRRRISRSLDATDSEPSHDSPDPLVAACGLHVPPSHGRPRSTASARSWTSHGVARERAVRPAHPRYDAHDAPHLPLECMTSLYLFTLWSSYVRAKHIQAVAYMEERVQLLPPADESAPLLHTRELRVTPECLRTLGLDPTSEIDRAVVQQILTPHSCTLRITRGWAR